VTEHDTSLSFQRMTQHMGMPYLVI